MKIKSGVLSVLIFFLAGCGRNPYNSSTADASRYGSDVSGTATFIAARSTMLGNCFACHGSWASWTEADFVAKGLLASRSLTDSILFTRIRGNGTGVQGDMPQNATLSSEQILSIRTWILNM